MEGSEGERKHFHIQSFTFSYEKITLKKPLPHPSRNSFKNFCVFYMFQQREIRVRRETFLLENIVNFIFDLSLFPMKLNSIS